ncbi:hypothetical protein DL95DRAFT_396470, partial [Leptodontidium sp. 2 PMI_412]
MNLIAACELTKRQCEAASILPSHLCISFPLLRKTRFLILIYITYVDFIVQVLEKAKKERNSNKRISGHVRRESRGNSSSSEQLKIAIQ